MDICVFGAASNEINPEYIKGVEKLGEEMAKRGHRLVFGAGNNGVMGASARGVKREGGKITGVIPEFFKDESIEQIYSECDELIYTETMAQRKAKMEDLAEAFIIAPGGIGTFEEFLEVLTLKQLGRHTKPIVIFDILGYYEKLEDFLKIAFEERFIRKDCRLLYEKCKTVEETLDYIENDERIQRDVHDLKNGWYKSTGNSAFFLF